jgi:hypothetical protein
MIRILLVFLALSACSQLPRDPDGTTERVTSERLFKVGMIATGDADSSVERQRALIARIAAATGARAALESGAAEPLLLRLEQGELDLVIGEFHARSPWIAKAHLLPPIAEARVGEEETIVAAAARHGENRWIMLVDRESRALAPPQ